MDRSHNGPGSDGEQDILTLKSFTKIPTMSSTDFEGPCFLLQSIETFSKKKPVKLNMMFQCILMKMIA